jgi:uncharacterized membrane protein
LTLSNLPMYSRYMSNDKILKKKSDYFGFYVRSMAPWNLTCEAQGKTRSTVLEQLKSGTKKNSSIIWMLVELSVIIVASTIGLFRGTICGNQVGKHGRIMTISLIVLVFALLNFYHTKIAANTSTEVQENLVNYSIVNGCSDSYTRVDIEVQVNSILAGNAIIED